MKKSAAIVSEQQAAQQASERQAAEELACIRDEQLATHHRLAVDSQVHNGMEWNNGEPGFEVRVVSAIRGNPKNERRGNCSSHITTRKPAKFVWSVEHFQSREPETCSRIKCSFAQTSSPASLLAKPHQASGLALM